MAVEAIGEFNEVIAAAGAAEGAVRRIHGRWLEGGRVATVDERVALRAILTHQRAFGLTDLSDDRSCRR